MAGLFPLTIPVFLNRLGDPSVQPFIVHNYSYLSLLKIILCMTYCDNFELTSRFKLTPASAALMARLR